MEKDPELIQHPSPLSTERFAALIEDHRKLDAREEDLPREQQAFREDLAEAQPPHSSVMGLCPPLVALLATLLLSALLTTGEAHAMAQANPSGELLLGDYRTNYTITGDDSPERVENLRRSSGAIDGTILAPGDELSFAALTSPLDYEEARAIVDGEKVKVWGGGLCQVSSTLYMAANYAGLEAVERHPHTSELSYIRPWAYVSLVNRFSLRGNAASHCTPLIVCRAPVS